MVIVRNVEKSHSSGKYVHMGQIGHGVNSFTNSSVQTSFMLGAEGLRVSGRWSLSEMSRNRIHPANMSIWVRSDMASTPSRTALSRHLSCSGPKDFALADDGHCQKCREIAFIRQICPYGSDRTWRQLLHEQLCPDIFHARGRRTSR